MARGRSSSRLVPSHAAAAHAPSVAPSLSWLEITAGPVPGWVASPPIVQVSAGMLREAITHSGNAGDILAALLGHYALRMDDEAELLTELRNLPPDEFVERARRARARSVLYPSMRSLDLFRDDPGETRALALLYPASDDPAEADSGLDRYLRPGTRDAPVPEFQVSDWDAHEAAVVLALLRRAAKVHPEGHHLRIWVQDDYAGDAAQGLRDSLGEGAWQEPYRQSVPGGSDRLVTHRSVQVDGVVLNLDILSYVGKTASAVASAGPPLSPLAESATLEELPLWRDRCRHRHMDLDYDEGQLPMRVWECTRCSFVAAWIPEHRMPADDRELEEVPDYLRRVQAVDVLRGVPPLATLDEYIARDGVWAPPLADYTGFEDRSLSLDEFFED